MCFLFCYCSQMHGGCVEIPVFSSPSSITNSCIRKYLWSGSGVKKKKIKKIELQSSFRNRKKPACIRLKKKGHHTARWLVVVSARWLAVQDSRANSGANSGAHGFWSASPFIWEKQTTCWKRTTELNRCLHLQQLERQMFPCGAATEPERLMGCSRAAEQMLNQVKSSHMVRRVKLALQNCHTLVAQVFLHSSGKKKAISTFQR